MNSKDVLQKKIADEGMRMMEQYLLKENSRMDTFEEENEALGVAYGIADRLKHSSSISEIAYCNSLLALFISAYFDNERGLLEMIKGILSLD